MSPKLINQLQMDWAYGHDFNLFRYDVKQYLDDIGFLTEKGEKGKPW